MQAQPNEATEPPAEKPVFEEIQEPEAETKPALPVPVRLRACLNEGRAGEAIALCSDLGLDPSSEPPKGAVTETRALCGRAHVAQGDRLLALGVLEGARRFWQHAVELDPRLLDDPAFYERFSLKKKGEPTPLIPVPKPAPKPPFRLPPEPSNPDTNTADIIPVPALETEQGAVSPGNPDGTPPASLDGLEVEAVDALEDGPSTRSTQKRLLDDIDGAGVEIDAFDGSSEPPADSTAQDTTKSTDTEETLYELGPRAARSLGVGVGAGYDGLTSLVVAWIYEGRVSVELSVGVIFPTLDSRIRLYGVDDAFSPVFGFGVVTPLDSEPYFDMDIPQWEMLYEYGTLLHFDIGLSWSPSPAFELMAGGAFLTTFRETGTEVGALVLFPLFAVQALAYF